MVSSHSSSTSPETQHRWVGQAQVLQQLLCECEFVTVFTFHCVQGVHLLQCRVADKPDGLAVAFVGQKFKGTLVQEHILCLAFTYVFNKLMCNQVLSRWAGHHYKPYLKLAWRKMLTEYGYRQNRKSRCNGFSFCHLFQVICWIFISSHININWLVCSITETPLDHYFL